MGSPQGVLTFFITIIGDTFDFMDGLALQCVNTGTIFKDSFEDLEGENLGEP